MISLAKRSFSLLLVHQGLLKIDLCLVNLAFPLVAAAYVVERQSNQLINPLIVALVIQEHRHDQLKEANGLICGSTCQWLARCRRKRHRIVHQIDTVLVVNLGIDNTIFNYLLPLQSSQII